MLKEDCKNFYKCNAPLCPLDETSIKHGVWYPNEEICKLSEYKELEWIKNQKKIQKKARDRDTYYTVDMLDKHIRITSAMKGLNPDNDYYVEFLKWIKAHPILEKREVSDEFKNRAREALKKYHETHKNEK